jgi:sugar phosphate isomerase/epimerase
MMKLGFVSAILADMKFEEVVDYAQENGFACVEMMCWPVGKAQRRYAGVTHIDIQSLTPQKAEYINNYMNNKGISISSLGYYPNPLDPDPVKRDVYTGHLLKMIEAAQVLNVGMITTFIGREKNATLEESFKAFRQIWTPIIRYAESKKIKVAIENCPMLFTADEWPGGLNMAISPSIWRRMFKEINSAYFGLNYDPSHLVWMQMDPVRPIYEFKEKIFHVHIKDVKVFKENLQDVGILATPLEYISPKLPGLGDVPWGKFISALTDIRYHGDLCIEVEDKAFEDSIEAIKDSILLSRNYIRQYIL